MNNFKIKCKLNVKIIKKNPNKRKKLPFIRSDWKGKLIKWEFIIVGFAKLNNKADKKFCPKLKWLFFWINSLDLSKDEEKEFLEQKKEKILKKIK